LIFNFDELIAFCKERKLKVITFKTFAKKNCLFKLFDQWEIEHTTIDLTISVARVMLPVLIIFLILQLSQHVFEDCITYFPNFWITGDELS
jgi:hypothetical protein